MALAVLMGATVTGASVGVFLRALDAVTALRFAQGWLIWFMPLGSMAVAWAYLRFGGDSARGIPLIVDRIHKPRAGVPWRMAPLIFATTLLTHLVGGSAGREGTAVQMGGSIAGALLRFARLRRPHAALLLLTGIAAGFGAVFGTPWTGAVFALELACWRRSSPTQIAGCIAAAFVGHWACHLTGAHHTQYVIATPNWWDAGLWRGVGIGALLLGGAAFFFCWTLEFFKSAFGRIRNVMARAAVGAAVVLMLTMVVGTRDYLGIGVVSPEPGGVGIVAAYQGDWIPAASPLLKLLFTTITVACGMKGGEATPLFFIGATFGSLLSGPMNVPVDLMAGIGMVAVFCAAAKTPLSGAVMGMELFGLAFGPVFFLANLIAWLVSGYRGIYRESAPPVLSTSAKITGSQP